MDAKFLPYFDARVQQIGSEGLTASPPARFGQAPLFSRPNQETVFNAVARGYGGLAPGLIRPDAELLLQLAFSELLAQPLLAVRGQELDMNNLSAAIEGDVRTITQSALGRGQPVSAHGIVDATSRSWSQLRTAGFQVWD